MSLQCADPVEYSYDKSFWSKVQGEIWASDAFTGADGTLTDPEGKNSVDVFVRHILHDPSTLTNCSSMSATRTFTETFIGDNPFNLTNVFKDISVPSFNPTSFLDTYTTFNNSARTAAYLGLPLDQSMAVDPLLNISRHVVFGSMSQQDQSVTVVNCSISSTHVESEVVCDGQNCKVTRMRYSLQDKRPSNVTPLDLDVMGSLMLRYMPTLGGDSRDGLSSPAEVFIKDTSVAPYNKEVYNGLIDLSKVSKENFSTRLGMILNTYFTMSTAPVAFLGDRPNNLSAYGLEASPINLAKTWYGENATVDTVMSGFWNSDYQAALTEQRDALATSAPFVAATTSGTSTRTYRVFVCSFVWVIILLITSITLLLLGSFGAILRARTLAPDVLGYVTSLTYHNPHMGDLPKRLPLDAMGRARALKSLRVRLGDTRPGDEYGHVAFTLEKECVALRRRRRYSA